MNKNNKKVVIIAEAGVNHNGDVNMAKQLIDAAAEAKADYVKFQSFKAEKLVSKKARKADYQIENTGDKDNSQFEMLKKLELSDQDHIELINYCKRKKIKFFSTAFDVDGIDYLDSLNFDIFKIPSGEITNYPYLKRIAQKNKPIILSTGMSNMKEIEDAINVLIKFGANKSDITVLHCNTEYPTPMQDVNLRAMLTIKKRFKVDIGYSDHTEGIEASLAAVALGAQIIEKHFILDKKLGGPDVEFSMDPHEFKEMVAEVRKTEQALGNSNYKLDSEDVSFLNVGAKFEFE